MILASEKHPSLGCPQTKDNLRQKTLLSSGLCLLFGEGKARSQEKRDGLRRNSRYPPTVEDIPRMLTMCTKRIWKSETKGYSSTFWRKRLYFGKILKQKSREERWVDMKFTISSASGRHPSPLLAASHSSWAAKPLLYSTKLHPFHSHLIIPIHNCFMWNTFTGTGCQSSGTE